MASARTMDGYKIRAKISLTFPRPVGNGEAEDVMMQYARAYAAIVECELSNGDLPFEEQELHQRITDTVQVLPRKNVRLIGLHVWHKGAVSSGSMLAVKPEGKATVPAMPAMSTMPPSDKASPISAHTATTIKPEAGGVAPPSARMPVTVPAPDQRSAAALRSPTTPAMRAPVPPPAPSSPLTPATSAVRSVAQPGTPAMAHGAPTRANMPAVGARPAPPPVGSPATRVMSGVVSAVEPRILRSKSGFLLALEQAPAETGDDVGRALAQPIRDAAAGLLLGTLDALHGSMSDPLAFFDGRVDPELRRALIGEACVCVCYVLYESLTRTSLPQMMGIQVVQAACVHALSDQKMPVSEISRYLATESPREEFAARACALLGTRESAELQQRVDTALRGLRIDVKTCAEQIELRLSRPKAAGGR